MIADPVGVLKQFDPFIVIKDVLEFFGVLDIPNKVLAVTDAGITVRPSDGLHFLLPQSWTVGPYYGTGGTFFADVTGDGVADAIAVNADKISVRPSTGEGFSSPRSWTIDPYYGNLSPICRN